MAAQSRPPILITRPEPQASRLARQLRAQDWVGRVHVSALLVPSHFPATLPDGEFNAVILTSETGALAAGRLPGLPRLAWCVGDRTARVAARQGLDAHSAKGDAAALVAALIAAQQPGRLLYLHGRETRGDLAERLNSAGIETVSLQIYAQDSRPLTPAARRLIRDKAPVILPVLSPRSADILVSAWRDAQGRAPAHVVALSPAVATSAQALNPASLTIAVRPDGKALLAALHALMQRAPWA